ncbi:MAG: matrixin family metalloprotease, partial [Planctomycetes bacterium]|nr:matrixin family metalloprotease [Planctomycetota bacterium]
MKKLTPLKTILFLLLPFLSAQADVIPMTVDGMIEKSAAILSGKVVAKASRMDPKRRILLTDFTLRIDEDFTGKQSGELTCTVLGGQLAGIEQRASFLNDFSVGEDMILMLRENARNSRSPFVGGWQGMIRKGEFSSGAKGKSASGWMQKSEEGKEVILDYEAFKSALRLRVAASKGSGRNKASRKSQLYRFGSGSAQPYTTFGSVATIPITFLVTPSSDTKVAGRDADMMEAWNKYAPLFDPQTLSAAWAIGNGKFEIAGFVNDDVMLETFELTWDDTGAVAFALSQSDSNQNILEADIFMNPYLNWTFDSTLPSRNPTYYLIDTVMTHELGHTLGLDHEFGVLAIMNYAQNQYEGDSSIHSNDAYNLRYLYPEHALAMTDLGVYLYNDASSQPFDYANSTLSSSVISPGTSFQVQNYSLENTGTSDVA